MTRPVSSDRELSLVRLGGVEPPTPALGEPRSIHLSYRRKTIKFLILKGSNQCHKFLASILRCGTDA